MPSKWGEIAPMTVEQIWRKLGLTDAPEEAQEAGLRQYISELKIVKPPLRASLRRAGYEYLIPLAGTAITAAQISPIQPDTEPIKPV